MMHGCFASCLLLLWILRETQLEGRHAGRHPTAAGRDRHVKLFDVLSCGAFRKVSGVLGLYCFAFRFDLFRFVSIRFVSVVCEWSRQRVRSFCAE